MTDPRQRRRRDQGRRGRPDRRARRRSATRSSPAATATACGSSPAATRPCRTRASTTTCTAHQGHARARPGPTPRRLATCRRASRTPPSCGSRRRRTSTRPGPSASPSAPATDRPPRVAAVPGTLPRMPTRRRSRGLVIAWMPVSQRSATIAERLGYDLVLIGRSGFRRPWTRAARLPAPRVRGRSRARRPPTAGARSSWPRRSWPRSSSWPVARAARGRRSRSTSTAGRCSIGAGGGRCRSWLARRRSSPRSSRCGRWRRRWRQRGVETLVIPDPLPDLDGRGRQPSRLAAAAGAEPVVVAICGWAADEPLQALVDAAVGPRLAARPHRAAAAGLDMPAERRAGRLPGRRRLSRTARGGGRDRRPDDARRDAAVGGVGGHRRRPAARPVGDAVAAHDVRRRAGLRRRRCRLDRRGHRCGPRRSVAPPAGSRSCGRPSGPPTTRPSRSWPTASSGRARGG